MLDAAADQPQPLSLPPALQLGINGEAEGNGPGLGQWEAQGFPTTLIAAALTLPRLAVMQVSVGSVAW